MYKVILILLLLTGCQAHVGVAYHPQGADQPDVNLRSDLGIVRLEKKHNDYTYFYEHISSLTKTEDGRGLNMFGVMKRIK